MSFDELGLNKDFAASIQAAGYESPTELQQQLIPHINDGRSVLVWTQSASGKTGSFLIPAINYVLSHPIEEHHGARVLILTSRRDRVNQINYTIKRLLRDQQIRSGFIVSGRPYQPQMRLLRRPLDLMIATPGRLNDLVDNKKASFDHLEMLIIDDLTAIYKKNLHPLIDKILAHRTTPYPIIAFVRHDEGATAYAHQILTGAQEITIQDEKTQILQLKHTVYLADDYTHKVALMDYLLSNQRDQPTIIYTAQSRTAKSLADSLANHGYIVDAVHLLAEEERNTDACPILIVADQEGIQPTTSGAERVIHFEMPEKVDDYLARMADFLGQARTDTFAMLVSATERDNLRKIEEYLGESFEQKTVMGLEPTARVGRTSKPAAERSGERTERGDRSKSTTSGVRRTGGDERSSAGRSNNQGRKGLYGRTNTSNDSGNGNGGASTQRKRHSDGGGLYMTPKVNLPSNNVPYDIGSWETQQDYMPSKPKTDKKVVIRYKEKRRTVIK